MAAHGSLKRIPIAQLIPGMSIVKMDVPWYQTPFLSHRWLVENRQTIQEIIDCGVQTVTIDVSKGRDVEAAVSGKKPDETEFPAHKETPDQQAQSQAESARAMYAEAHEAMERIFTDLERN